MANAETAWNSTSAGVAWTATMRSWQYLQLVALTVSGLALARRQLHRRSFADHPNPEEDPMTDALPRRRLGTQGLTLPPSASVP